MEAQNDPVFNAAWHNGQLTDDQLALLTQEQSEKYKQHLEYLAEHKGHESRHEMMVIILLFALFASQFLILHWKKKHYSSYQIVSLAGLYIFPVLFALYDGWYRFLAVWSIFSVINGYVIRKASQKPLEAMTPRMVYKWYTVVYNASFAVGFIGYIIIMIVFLFGALFSNGDSIFQAGILMLSYGLYFGVLGRDFVEICSDRMAATIGYYAKDGLPQKHLTTSICAVCAQPTASEGGSLVEGRQHAFADDPVHQLACKHVFHEKCIRGWCLIGKKDICPYCKEKVDLKQFKKNPWDTQQQLYLNILDAVRYLVVWQPLIIAGVQLSYYILGLD